MSVRRPVGNLRKCASIANLEFEQRRDGAGSVAANGSTGEIQARFHKNDWSNFTQTNDYSFDATKTAYADWTKVTLYQNGTLVWGTAP